MNANSAVQRRPCFTLDPAVEMLDEIRRLLQSPRPHPKQWARDILEAHAEHRGLQFINRVTGNLDPIGPQPVSDLQVAMATEALGPRAQRQPGEDDE